MLNIKEYKRLIPLFALALVLTALFSVGGYGFHKIAKIENENKLLREQINQETILKDAEAVVSDEVVEEKVDDIVEDKKQTDTSIAEIKPVSTSKPEVVATEQSKDSTVTNDSTEKAPEVVSSQNPIEITAIRQTSYPDEYGGLYGSYEIEVSVTLTSGEILIPNTTSNTIGVGNIGLSYSVVGDSFKGHQDSKISCSMKRDDNCLFKGDGKTRKMTVTIFLYPSRDDTGNFGVKFENIKYYQDGKEKNLSVNRKTANIHLFY